MLYNGAAPYPEEKVISLSDAFEKTGLIGIIDKGSPAQDTGRIQRFRRQGEGEYENEIGNLEEAIKKTIIYCRGHDILREFLEKNATEVINMLMIEFMLDSANIGGKRHGGVRDFFLP